MAVSRPELRIDLEIQLLRLVQVALAGAEIVTQRSEEVRHQGSSLMSISGIRLAELGTHPLFLHAELDPEREEDENENDEPAHLGDGNRHAKETGQNAGVDGVTDHGIGPVVISSWPCLMVTERLQLLPRCSRAQTANRMPAMVTAAPSQKGQKPTGQSW